MTDDQLDRAFDNIAVGRAPEIPPAVAEKIRAHIQRDTRPVKPMLPVAAYSVLFAVVFGVVALAFGASLGFKGLHLLSVRAATELLGVLIALAVTGAAMVARSMRPASGPLHSWVLGALAVILYEVLALTLFADYSTAEFMHRGVVCLTLGVLCAAVAGLPIWFIVRIGFVVDPVRSGAVIGLVSGLAGLTALTLHCNILTAPHTAVWHAAVIVVCVAGGALIGKRVSAAATN